MSPASGLIIHHSEKSGQNQGCADQLDPGTMIKKFLSNAMLSIVMDKSAKEKFHAVQETRKALKNKDKLDDLADATPVPQSPAVDAPPSVDRQELIRTALAVHKEQSKVFDNLNENEKRRLQLLAMHTMLGKGAR